MKGGINIIITLAFLVEIIGSLLISRHRWANKEGGITSLEETYAWAYTNSSEMFMWTFIFILVMALIKSNGVPSGEEVRAFTILLVPLTFWFLICLLAVAFTNPAGEDTFAIERVEVFLLWLWRGPFILWKFAIPGLKATLIPGTVAIIILYMLLRLGLLKATAAVPTKSLKFLAKQGISGAFGKGSGKGLWLPFLLAFVVAAAIALFVYINKSIDAKQLKLLCFIGGALIFGYIGFMIIQHNYDETTPDD